LKRYKLTFEYDGTRFGGWQKQPDVRTVEGVIEEALCTLFQDDIDIIGQGRTDAGVHASAQVAHVDLPDKYQPIKIISAMKSLLPPDVALISINTAENNFNARFDAISRTYRYQVIQRPSPLMRHMCWYVFRPVNKSILDECAYVIHGEHDFVNFCIPADNGYQTTICTISDSRWRVEGDLLIYHITANRFLRHMVRRLAGSMIMVATGQLRYDDFTRLMTQKEMEKKGFSAPAKGLILESVMY
jgi:tRNA pseudouridine38-40 synthase